MFELYFGTDITATRQAALARAEKLKKAGAVVTHIEADSFTPGMLIDAVGGVSLFGEDQCFVIDTPSVDNSFSEELKKQLSALTESAHTFVIIEGPLLAAEKKHLSKGAKEVFEFKAEAVERYNVFALADSLAKKDKKQLWMQLQEATVAGLSAEELIGTLWWQVKSLRLAALTSSAVEAGMKDYPYQKAKRALSNFKPGELEALSASLSAVYHDGHGGVRDINLALETWVLSL